jgi:hypothetical protein
MIPAGFSPAPRRFFNVLNLPGIPGRFFSRGFVGAACRDARVPRLV